jgi:F-box and leucine-rich repeat protein 2/20
LNISRLEISNFTFCRLVKNCKKLKNINISFCVQLTDASISRLLQNCKDLECINFSFCHQIKGSFFKRSTGNLKTINFDQCTNIQDINLFNLLSANPNITKLSLKQFTGINLTQSLLYIVNNMNKLETLLLNDTGFDSLLTINIDNILFERFQSLVHLDISNSKGDNQFVSKILRNSRTLKKVNLSYCIKLTDEAFISINCPIEDLDLNFLAKVISTKKNY